MRLFILAAFIGAILLRGMPAQAEDSPLKLAYNSGWPPYSSGVGEAVVGILPTLMDEILVKRMGMAVEHHGAPWARVQHYVESGKMDAFVTVPTEKRLEYATSSDSIVYRFEMRPIVRGDSAAEAALNADPSIDTLKTLRVCDMRANGWAINFYEKNEMEFHAAADAAACLRLINGGRLDVIIQPAAIGLQSIKQQFRGELLTPLPHVFGLMEFTLLLSKQSPEFEKIMPQFDATIAAMKEDGSYDRIVNELRQNPPGSED